MPSTHRYRSKCRICIAPRPRPRRVARPPAPRYLHEGKQSESSRQGGERSEEGRAQARSSKLLSPLPAPPLSSALQFPLKPLSKSLRVFTRAPLSLGSPPNSHCARRRGPGLNTPVGPRLCPRVRRFRGASGKSTRCPNPCERCLLSPGPERRFCTDTLWAACVLFPSLTGRKETHATRRSLCGPSKARLKTTRLDGPVPQLCIEGARTRRVDFPGC